MSLTTPGSTPDNSEGGIVLPPGVTIGPARETSAANSAGQIVQGVNLPVLLPNGGSLNVFVPYASLGNTAQVQQLLDERIKPILALPGQQN